MLRAMPANLDLGRAVRAGAFCALPFVAVACGGGGGGSSPVTPGGSGPPVALSGLVTDDASPLPSPLAGATVSIYKAGVALTGAVPLATATTSPTGMWSVAVGPPPGSYLLQIAPADGVHATLHRNVTLAAGANAISNPQLTVLSAMEQQCITLFNQRRVALGVPSLPVDNAAMIAARAEAVAVTAWGGIGQFPDPTPGAYLSAGGIGSVASPDWDSGAADCTMAVGNLLSAIWNGKSNDLFPINASSHATWLGFGTALQPLPGFPTNTNYAAAVVSYP